MKERVYERLRQAAEDGESCPTTSSMAGMLGTNTTVAAKAIEELVDAGLISIEKSGSHRRVTIVETCQKTDWTNYQSVTRKPGRICELRCPPDWPADYSGYNITRWRW